MIKIFKSGRHARRTPFSYAALSPLWTEFAELVETPTQADLYLFAHSLDIAEAPQALVEDWRSRRRPVVLLSEEPFWDTIWGRRPLARQIVLDSPFGPLPVIQLNHHSSTIFDFDRIPYYLLTNHRFANTYAARFHRNARIRPSEWQARFAERAVELTFMFEHRPELYHNARWHEGDIIGLCAWRTGVALACNRGQVERLGQSWQGGRTRFELDNWHMDKMVRLDGHSRIIAAFENTHQPNYITEKLFDAFASGALPLYYASPGHRVHDFGLPMDAWVNLFDMSVEEAATRISAVRFSPDLFEAYAQAQADLARLFCNPGIWVAERARLARRLRIEMEQVLEVYPRQLEN